MKEYKVVVHQSVVGKGFLGNEQDPTKKEFKDIQYIITQCMKSVKAWCNKKGYKYILNTKDLNWNYFNPQMEKIGFKRATDREKDLCAQRHEICLGTDADYIMIFDNDVWIYKDFDLPKIEHIGLCICTNAIPHDNMNFYQTDHLHYIRRLMDGDIHYPQGRVQFIKGTANKHYNEGLINSIKKDKWPIVWDGTEQSHIYYYIRKYPEKITWLGTEYNCIPGRPQSTTEEDIRNSNIIHICGPRKLTIFNMLPLDMQKELKNIK